MAKVYNFFNFVGLLFIWNFFVVKQTNKQDTQLKDCHFKFYVQLNTFSLYKVKIALTVFFFFIKIDYCLKIRNKQTLNHLTSPRESNPFPSHATISHLDEDKLHVFVSSFLWLVSLTVGAEALSLWANHLLHLLGHYHKEIIVPFVLLIVLTVWGICEF